MKLIWLDRAFALITAAIPFMWAGWLLRERVWIFIAMVHTVAAASCLVLFWWRNHELFRWPWR